MPREYGDDRDIQRNCCIRPVVQLFGHQPQFPGKGEGRDKSSVTQLVFGFKQKACPFNAVFCAPFCAPSPSQTIAIGGTGSWVGQSVCGRIFNEIAKDLTQSHSPLIGLLINGLEVRVLPGSPSPTSDLESSGYPPHLVLRLLRDYLNPRLS